MTDSTPEEKPASLREIVQDTGEFPTDPRVAVQLAHALHRVLSHHLMGREWTVAHCLPGWLRDYAQDAIERFLNEQEGTQDTR
jgi:hypothetical protein